MSDPTPTPADPRIDALAAHLEANPADIDALCKRLAMQEAEATLDCGREEVLETLLDMLLDGLPGFRSLSARQLAEEAIDAMAAEGATVADIVADIRG